MASVTARAAILAALALPAVSNAAARGSCKIRPGLAGESMLLQTSEAKMLARASERPPLRIGLVQVDAQAAQCLQRSRLNPADLGTMVAGGLSAVVSSLPHFTAKPPRIGEGLNAMGQGLLWVVDPLRVHFNNTDTFQDFQREWLAFFDDIPEKVEGIQQQLDAYAEEGQPSVLMSAIGEILTSLSDGVVQFVPHATAQEVVKYVNAVSDILDAVGASWAGFQSGQTVQAVEDLYFALRVTVEGLVPESIRNDETYQIVIGALDGVVGDLSETALAYQRRMLEGNVCWKTQGARTRKRPHICPNDHSWDGQQFCIPHTSPMGLIGLEASVSRKSGGVDSSTSRKQRVADGAVLAECEQGSPWSEKIGHWCYAGCPDGMEQVALQCRTVCRGAYPADDGALLCGRSKEAIVEAIANIVGEVSSSAITAGFLIDSLVKDGVDTESLVKTIAAFGEMGKPFAHQNCPLDGTAVTPMPTAAPTGAPSTATPRPSRPLAPSTEASTAAPSTAASSATPTATTTTTTATSTTTTTTTTTATTTSSTAVSTTAPSTAISSTEASTAAPRMPTSAPPSVQPLGQCADFNSDDCLREFLNVDEGVHTLDAVCGRCSGEPGLQPLQTRCRMCCERCGGSPAEGPVVEASIEKITLG